MTVDNMIAYTEVYEIINLLEEKYRKRVPEKVLDFFETERVKDYKPEIKIDVPLIEQGLKRETMVLLAILQLNYWCDSEEEKQQILKEFEDNEIAKRELEEKYNLDNLFKKKNKVGESLEIEREEDTQLMEYKQSNFIKRILEKIKSLFKK